MRARIEFLAEACLIVSPPEASFVLKSHHCMKGEIMAGHCPAYALSLQVFQTYRPEVLEEYREPIESRFSLEPTEAVVGKGEERLKTLLLIPSEVVEELPSNHHHSINDVEVGIDSQRGADRLMSCLSTEEKILVCMVLVDERTPESVAESFGCTPREVKRSVDRAVDQMRKGILNDRRNGGIYAKS